MVYGRCVRVDVCGVIVFKCVELFCRVLLLVVLCCIALLCGVWCSRLFVVCLVLCFSVLVLCLCCVSGVFVCVVVWQVFLLNCGVWSLRSCRCLWCNRVQVC